MLSHAQRQRQQEEPLKTKIKNIEFLLHENATVSSKACVSIKKSEDIIDRVFFKD